MSIGIHEKVPLSVADRLTLASILPKTGTYADMKGFANLRAALDFTEEEKSALHFSLSQDVIRWERSAETVKPVEFDESTLGKIRKILRALNQSAGLTEATMPLYERFIGE